MKKVLSLLLLFLVAMAGWAQYWTGPESTDYQGSTNINFEMKLDGALVDASAYIEVAAFIDGECRGDVIANSSEFSLDAPTAEHPDGMIHYGHLKVYGNSDDQGKKITLKTKINGEEYTFRKQYDFDGETHGDLSHLEEFNVLDLVYGGYFFYLDDIHLHLTDKPVSDNLIDMMRAEYYDDDIMEVVKYYFRDLSAFPSTFTTKWDESNYVDFEIEANDKIYAHAKRRTKKYGESVSGKISFRHKDFDIWGMVYVEPYDPLDHNIRILLNDVHLEVGEKHDMKQEITVLFLKEGEESGYDENGEIDLNKYIQVPCNDLEAYLGYKPQVNFVTMSDRYEVDEDLVLTALYPTTKDGLFMQVTVGTNQVFGEGMLYITPYDILDGHVEFELSSIECDLRSSATADLRDYIQVKQYSEDFSSYELFAYKEFFKDFEARYGYDPVSRMTFIWKESDAYSVGADQYSLEALLRTSPEGTPISGNIAYLDGINYPLASTLYVKPFERMNGEVEMLLSDFYMERGGTADAREHIIFRITEDGETVDIPFNGMEDYLGYDPAFTWHWQFEGNDYYKVGADGYTLTALKSTTEEGYPCSMYLEYKGIESRIFAQSAMVYIQPYAYFDSNVKLRLDDITVYKYEPVDLRDHLTFDFYDSEDHLERTVSYRNLERELGYCPDFKLRLVEASEYYNVDGFILTAVKETAGAPISIILDAAELDFIYRASATVTVVIDDIALEDMQIRVPRNLNRFETSAIKVTIVPEKASVLVGNFNVSIISDDVDYAEAGWNPMDAHFEERGDGIYFVLCPYIIGTMQVVVSYDDGKYQYENSFSVTSFADQEFHKDWAWYTFYYLNSKQPLETIDQLYFDGKIVDVRSESATNYKDPDYGFFGDLTDITPEGCYKVKATLDKDFTFHYPNCYGAPGILTKSLSVQLNPGWNWIPYPYQYSRDFFEIAAILPVAEGNRMVSLSDGFAECDGEDWMGSIETFRYGNGFIFYNAGEETDLVYPSELSLSQPDFSELSGSNQRAASHHWDFNPAAYPNNMTLIAQLDGVDEARHLTMGAFVGGECRGEGRVVDCNGEQLFFITVHGKAGEQITFRLGAGSSEFRLAETLAFTPAAGSLRQPVRFLAPEGLNGIPVLSATSGDETLYDLSGRRILSPSHGVYIRGGKKIIKK